MRAILSPWSSLASSRSKLQDAVERHGLYYPPDPASRARLQHWRQHRHQRRRPALLEIRRDARLRAGSGSSAGGRLGGTAGRPHPQNKTGFDLHRLFVGSEGLLGIVTEATLKLLPLPPYRACLGVGFGSMRDAARAIRAIFGAGILPCALELADAFTLTAAQKRTGSNLLAGCRAHIIVELDGQERSVRLELKQLEKIVRCAKTGLCPAWLRPDGL